MDSDSDDDLFSYAGTLKSLSTIEKQEKQRKEDEPFPIKETVPIITLDSDDDSNFILSDGSGSDIVCTSSSNINPNVSFDDSEMEEIVKLSFSNHPSVVYRFTVKRCTALAPIFNELAASKQLTAHDIDVYSESGIEVSPFDTLKSIDYDFTQTLQVNIRGQEKILQDCNPPVGSFLIKCKLADRKSKVLEFYILPQQCLDILIKKCARELDCDVNKFKLVFDGDIIKPTDTCGVLDLESGDTVELHWKT